MPYSQQKRHSFQIALQTDTLFFFSSIRTASDHPIFQGVSRKPFTTMKFTTPGLFAHLRGAAALCFGQGLQGLVVTLLKLVVSPKKPGRKCV